MWLTGSTAHCCCPASGDSIVLHIDSAGKDQNFKLEVQFLLECILLSLHCKFKKIISLAIAIQGPSVPQNNTY